jgi:hypothetical protein
VKIQTPKERAQIAFAETLAKCIVKPASTATKVGTSICSFLFGVPRNDVIPKVVDRLLNAVGLERKFGLLSIPIFVVGSIQSIFTVAAVALVALPILFCSVEIYGQIFTYAAWLSIAPYFAAVYLADLVLLAVTAGCAVAAGLSGGLVGLFAGAKVAYDAYYQESLPEDDLIIPDTQRLLDPWE